MLRPAMPLALLAVLILVMLVILEVLATLTPLLMLPASPPRLATLSSVGGTTVPDGSVASPSTGSATPSVVSDACWPHDDGGYSSVVLGGAYGG